MKFNIIITCKDKYEYLIKNLFYINVANHNKGHDVTVYTVTNKEYNADGFNNIKIIPTFINDNEKFFNKSLYINKGIKKMRKNYDYFMQWDADLIMNNELFNNIEKDKSDWIVLSGEKLSKESTDYLQEKLLKWDNIQILGKDNKSIRENRQCRYVGNIAVKKDILEKYMEIMKTDKLYNESFKGWGGEDSLLSITTSKMMAYGLLKKVYFYDAWNHLWHEREMDKQDFDKRQQQKNIMLLNDQLIHNETKIRNYKNRKV